MILSRLSRHRWVTRGLVLRYRVKSKDDRRREVELNSRRKQEVERQFRGVQIPSNRAQTLVRRTRHTDRRGREREVVQLVGGR